VLANFTGAAATANLEDGRTVEVADGAAISVKLREGDHTITMTPKCLQTYDVRPTVVTVVKALPVPEPSGPASGPTGSSGATGTPLLASPPEGAPLVDSAGAPGRSADPVPSSTAESDTADGPDVRDAFAARPNSAPDARGARLLGLIAAICVFGVTSAIIRAIVAERATGALGI